MRLSLTQIKKRLEALRVGGAFSVKARSGLLVLRRESMERYNLKLVVLNGGSVESAGLVMSGGLKPVLAVVSEYRRRKPKPEKRERKVSRTLTLCGRPYTEPAELATGTSEFRKEG